MMKYLALPTIEDLLILHEDLRLQPYVDTEGHWTIGCGYNLDARGYDFLNKVTGRHVGPPPDGMTEKVLLTEAEARLVLKADVARVEAAVKVHFPEYLKLDAVRRKVVLDMAFNLGFRALGFVHTIAAIKQRNWSVAAREMYKSKWARQVGGRCDRLARMLLTGKEPDDVPASVRPS